MLILRYFFSLLSSSHTSTGLPSRMVHTEGVPDQEFRVQPLLTYLILCHCCRIRHNAHQKQTTSLCRNHRETPPGTCGCRPWAGTLPCTLPVWAKTGGNLRRQAKTGETLTNEWQVMTAVRAFTRSWEAQLFLLPPKYRKTPVGTCNVNLFFSGSSVGLGKGRG